MERPSDEEQLRRFEENGRTTATHIVEAFRYRTKTIPEWSHIEENRGHPPVKSRFHSIYDLTYGDPVWKKKRIPIGENLLSLPNVTYSMTTEHREAFNNPKHSTAQSAMTVSDDDNESDTSESSSTSFDVTCMPKDRLIPTSRIGIKETYLNPPTLRAYLPHTKLSCDNPTNVHKDQ